MGQRLSGLIQGVSVTGRRGIGVTVSIGVAALACSMFSAATASAAPPFLWQSSGVGGGATFSNSRGVAVSPSSAPTGGNVFLADSNNDRVVELSPWGAFERAWGWGVVASGPGNDPQNEIQAIAVDATAGTFKVQASFLQMTEALGFNASAEEVETALENLSEFGFSEEIATGDGSVAVTGPNGGPWNIEFTGANADIDLPQLRITSSTLSGGSGAAVATSQQGAKFEICVPGSGDICQNNVARSRYAAGSGSGYLNNAQGIAIDSGGSTYVVDQANNRVQKFDPDGNFLRMWGGDVIATGPGQSGAAEVQSVTVKATSGIFTLSFDGGTTSPLDFDAAASEVEAALNALPTIGGVEGAVSVTGGPGDETGSEPYVVTFEDALGGFDVPQISIGAADLGLPIGTELTCASTTSATTTSFQWLSDGAPATGPGATTATYETVAADAGNPVQCRVTKQNANAGSTQVSNPRTVVSSVPSPPPPLAPLGNIPSPSPANPTVGTSLTCNPSAASWSGVTEPFEYQWYKNGVAISGAEGVTYGLVAGDTPAVFQCAVTGSNASGSVTKVSQNRATSPAPSPAAPPSNTGSPNVTISSPLSSLASTTTQGISGAEICIAGVNTCKAGVQSAGSGQFGAWMGQGSYIAVDSADRIYVGDVGRVQRFNSDGEFQGQITEGIGPAENVQSLTVGPGGTLYASISGQSNVRRWSAFPAFASLSPVVVPGGSPQALATDDDETLYAITGSSALVHKVDPDTGAELESWGQEEPPVPKFGASTGIAASSACLNPGEEPNVYVANSVPGNSFVRAYGPHPDFELPPDSGLCPPPTDEAPAIEAQHALTVSADSATVRAEINPLFWPDAHYYVQYGTEACVAGGWESPCVEDQPAPPGLLLTGNVVSEVIATAPIFLDGLDPGTPYKYRFAAESSGGGPVFGIGATNEEPEGEESRFTTFGDEGIDGGCSNEDLRVGPSTQLPECRAYELVSPPEKNGADAVAPDNVAAYRSEAAHFRSSADGRKISYASTVAFADAKAGPFSVGYVASRSEEDWSTHGILPAQGTNIDINTPAYAWDHVLDFSADLGTSWQYTDATPPPPGGVPGYRNLYRCENASVSCEALTTVTPPSWEPGDQFYKQWLAGHSADGSVSVYAANDKLTEDASSATVSGQPIFQLYEKRAGEEEPNLVSVLPDDSASGQHSFIGGGLERLQGAVSSDGSRVYWTSGLTLAGPSTSVSEDSTISGRIYLRKDGTETIPVSDTVAPAGQMASFWIAAKDGSAALFTIGDDLYRFDLESESSTPIAEGGVVGVGGAAENLSRAYFVSTEVLDGEPNSEGDNAEPGKRNVYFYEQGVGVRFVATPETQFNIYANGSSSVADRLDYVSPDGNTLIFTAYNSLTDFDNSAAGNNYMEVFRYSAAEDQLDCVSCNPSGSQPLGRDVVKRKPFISAQIPGWRQGPYYQQRVISDDGDRVYFESFDRLAPADANGNMDVYQWLAPGAGGCSTEAAAYSSVSGGCLSLISTGESDADSTFIEATPNGSTVFFRTSERLVGIDRDNLFDVYAARVGGGLASQQPPADPAPCAGEGCRGAGSTPPANLGAGSAAFAGPGNAAPRPSCKEAARLARKHGRAAKRLRRQSGRLLRAGNRSKARRLAESAKRQARTAKRNAMRAKRCRQARRAGAEGRTGR